MYIRPPSWSAYYVLDYAIFKLFFFPQDHLVKFDDSNQLLGEPPLELTSVSAES